VKKIIPNHVIQLFTNGLIILYDHILKPMKLYQPTD